jgi:hypothetical protein
MSARLQEDTLVVRLGRATAAGKTNAARRPNPIPIFTAVLNYKPVNIK